MRFSTKVEMIWQDWRFSTFLSSQAAHLTIADLKKLNSSFSFSAAMWESVAPSLGLRADLGIEQLDTFTIPIAVLPPSFHRELMKNASQWMDVYQEPPSHMREESRLRLLEAVCIYLNVLSVYILI